MALRFFLLQMGLFTQYEFAWYEPTGKAKYGDAPQCEACGAYVDGGRWLPPYEVDMKQPRTIGDFVAGPGGCDFLLSDRALKVFQLEKVKGIQSILPITILKMGTTKKGNTYRRPKLHGISVTRAHTRILYEKMGVRWAEKPERDYCRVCGPGGGGSGGVYRSYERIVVNELSYSGEDVFKAANFPGHILLSEKAVNTILSNKLTNASIVPCEHATYSY
jgi:hypothetical protein